MKNSSIFSDWCPSCGNTNLIQSLEPEGSLHYGRVSCANCERFIKWLPKPKVPETSIIRLLNGIGLEPWERKFLKAVACRTPTKAESIVIEAIQAKVNPDRTEQGVKLC